MKQGAAAARGRAVAAWSVSTAWVGNARGHTRLVLPVTPVFVNLNVNGTAISPHQKPGYDVAKKAIHVAAKETGAGFGVQPEQC